MSEENKTSATVLQLVPPKREADPDLVAKAEQLLELVRGGEVNALAFAVVFADGCVGSAYDHTATGSLFALLGGVDYMHSRIMAKVQE